MHLPPPHVPPAVQLAFSATQGPRALPGTYTIRMENNGKTYDTKIEVGLDRRVAWSLADRRAQFQAAMQVDTLFNDEAALFAQIVELREQVDAAGKGRSKQDPLARKLGDFDAKLDAVRKEIVATTEGGAITGEERLREHTDQLYGAVTSWDGPPSRYQLDNIAGLTAQLGAIRAEFATLTTKDLPPLNSALKAKGAQVLTVPPLAAFDDDEPAGAGGRAAAGRFDPDAAGAPILPTDLRLWN
jgi:hypothetical protein